MHQYTRRNYPLSGQAREYSTADQCHPWHRQRHIAADRQPDHAYMGWEVYSSIEQHTHLPSLSTGLLTRVASLLRRFRSTIMRCSLRTRGVWSSSVRKASTKARGGYTPFTLEHEIRRLCRKAESSGASSKSSSFNRSCSCGWSLASTPLKQAPYFRQPMMVAAPTKPRISKGPIMMQICCARVRATVALANASSFWALCSCGVSWWKLLPRPPLRNPTLVCASKTR